MDVYLMEGAPDFDEPLALLKACHGRITQRLDALERALDGLGDPRGGDWAPVIEVFAWMRQYFNTAGHLHTADEEESLFPRLRATGWPAAGGAALLERLDADHRKAENMYASLTERCGTTVPAEPDARQQLADDFRAWIALYREHIVAEEAEVPDAARTWLDADELAAIGREMRARRGGAPAEANQ